MVGEWLLIFGNLTLKPGRIHTPFPSLRKKSPRGRLLSVLDLRHGFHQMPLRKDSRSLTCMRIPCGQVQWTVMPMGLKKAPSFFQRMMEDLLFTARPELLAFGSVYIHYIIIATEGEELTKEELVAFHGKQLNQLIDILDANQLIFGPKMGMLFFN